MLCSLVARKKRLDIIDGTSSHFNRYKGHVHAQLTTAGRIALRTPSGCRTDSHFVILFIILIVDTLGTTESSIANMSTRGMNDLLVYANHSMHINTMSIFNVHVNVCMLNISFF